MYSYIVFGRALVKIRRTKSWLTSYPAWHTNCSNSVMSLSRLPLSSCSPFARAACASSCSITFANCLLNKSKTSAQSLSSWGAHP
jgi:hypothetical protein